MIIIIILKYSRLRWKVFTITIYILFFIFLESYLHHFLTASILKVDNNVQYDVTSMCQPKHALDCLQ